MNGISGCVATRIFWTLYNADVLVYSSDVMKLGSSLPWPDALEAITGSRSMSAEPLVEYFEPLLQWLKKENKGHPIGWNEMCRTA